MYLPLRIFFCLQILPSVIHVSMLLGLNPDKKLFSKVLILLWFYVPEKLVSMDQMYKCEIRFGILLLLSTHLV